MFDRSSTIPIVCAALVLALGVSVYLFDRSAADLAFIPTWWAFADGTPELFGAVGGSFPSFAHTFCFALLIAALVAPWGIDAWKTCLAWGVVEAALELAQNPSAAILVDSVLPAWFADWPILQNIPVYFAFGRFDLLDLTGVVFGATTAWLTLTVAVQPGAHKSCIR